jgi:hypothetical protein
MPDFNQTPPEFAPAPPPPAPSAETLPVPQFSTAEYAHVPGTERCRVCGNLISGEYYRVNGQMVCAVCGYQAASGQPKDSHTAFLRGILLGFGAAIVGLAVYSAFTIATHIYLGYLALGVGWFVGKAIMKGSNGLGGLHYQIAALALTYFSISVAAVPILIHAVMQNPRYKFSVGQLIMAAWPKLLWNGIASPFLRLQNPFQGALGLLILFVALRIAWQVTAPKPVPIDGPFPVATA